MIRWLFKYLASVVLIVVVAAAGTIWWSTTVLSQALTVPDENMAILEDEPFIFYLPSGASVRQLPTLLQSSGFIDETEAMKLRIALRVQLLLDPTIAQIKHGEYDLRFADDVQSLLAKMHKADVYKRQITLVEGAKFSDIKFLLKTFPNIQNTIEDMSDEEIMAALDAPDSHPEGWFAPDTYFYTKHEKDIDILKRALIAQRERLEEAWADKIDDLPYETAYEALIMASIIERETSVPDERRDIAGVFVRRLERDMRLQTDPTVIYGMGDSFQGKLRQVDLRASTPYNTYVITGLPPTPISMPGKASIDAALDPAPGKTLYFVAKGDGTHHFSSSYAEHKRAVQRYQVQRRKDYRSAPTGEED